MYDVVINWCASSMQMLDYIRSFIISTSEAFSHLIKNLFAFSILIIDVCAMTIEFCSISTKRSSRIKEKFVVTKRKQIIRCHDINNRIYAHVQRNFLFSFFSLSFFFFFSLSLFLYLPRVLLTNSRKACLFTLWSH